MAIHSNATPVTASSNADKLFRKPEAQIYLQKHLDKAKNRIVGLVDSEKEEIALRASQDIIDRNEGKAIQRTVTTTNGITLSVDMSGSTINLNQKTDS